MKSLHFLKHRVPLSTLLISLCLNAFTIKAWADDCTYTIGWGSASGTSGTYTNFTATSGTVTDILSFSTAKNSAGTAPAYNFSSSELRLYYASNGKGGSITLTPATGVTITGFTITTSTSPTTKYKVGSGSLTSITLSNNTGSVTGLSVSSSSSITIQNCNTTNTQLRIKTIQITYTGGSCGSGGGASDYTLYFLNSSCTGGSYSSNTGTSGSETISGITYAKYSGIASGTSVTVTAAEETGYTFDGWNDGGYSIILDDDGNEVIPSSSTSTTATFSMPSKDVWIYTCNFSSSAPSHTITFNYGANNTFVSGSSGASGSSGTATVTTSSLANLPSVTPCSKAASEGWVFDGWSESSVAANSSSYTKITAPYAPATDKTVYAVFKKGGNTMSSVSLTQVSTTVPSAGQYVAFTSISNAESVISNTTTTNYSGLIKVNPGDNSSYSSSSLTTTNATTIYKLESAGTSGSYTYYYLKNVVNGMYLAATSNDKEMIFAATTSDAAAWRFRAASTVWYLCNKSYSTGWFYYDSTNKYWECRRSASDPSSGNYQVNMYTISPSSVTITASYQSTLDCTDKYHVYYDANGADGGSVPVDDNEYTSGSATVLGNTGTLTREGYTWSCWNTNAAGTGTDKAAGNTVTISGADFYLYAKWTPNPYRLDVASVANVVITATPASGSAIAEGANANVDCGKTVTLNCSSLTSGYNFSGWTVYKTDDSNTTVTVSGSGNGATFTMPTYAVTVSATITPPWVYFTNCSSTLKVYYNANTSVASVANMPTDNNEYDANAYVSIPNTTPTRTGYTFDKWFTNAACTTPVGGYAVNTSNAFQITSTTTLYAHWNPISYSVRFNKNDNSATGTMSDESFDYDESKALTSNGFTLSGKTFIGWATSANGDVVYTDGQTVSNLSSTNDAVVDLYAKWATTYTVTYSVATGDATAPSPHTAITSGNSITLESHTSTLTCAKFVGWYAGDYSSASKPSFYAAGSSYTPSGDVTLKALYAIVGDNYELVTDVSDLSVGSQVVIATNSNTYKRAIGAALNSDVRSAIEVTISDGILTFDDEDGVTEFVLAEGSTSGYYAFKDGDAYLCGSGNNSNNYLKTENSVSNKSSFVISISGSNTSITANYSGRNVMSYNHNNENGTTNFARFACYSSSQTCGVQIFQRSISSYTTSPSCVSYTVTLAVTGHASGSAKIGSVATAATPSTSQSTTVSGAGSVRIKDIAAVAGYNYTVTQTSGTTATLTDNGDGTFTVSGLSSNATFTVTYSAKPTYDITFNVGTAGTGTYSKLTAYNGETVPIPAGYTPTSSCGIFVGWSPGVKATTGSRPATIITAGGSYTHATEANIVMYAVYSFTGGCTQEFAAGRSGDYLIYGEDDDATKYYVTVPTTTPSSGNTISFYMNDESSSYYNPATLTLSYNSASSTYCILLNDLYLTLNSSDAIEYSSTNAFEWTLNSNTCGYYFTGTYPGRTSRILGISSSGGTPNRFTSISSSSIPDDCTQTGYLISSIGIHFEVAGGVSYYTDYSCGSSTVDVTFDWSGTMTWPTGKTASSYTNLARCSDVTEFPTAAYDGWTFLGWSTTEYNDTYSSYLDAEYNSYTEDPGSNTLYSTSGNHLTLGTANVTLYPVFTKYPDNEDFDIDAGGDYYIYYYKDADFFKDTYYDKDSHLTRMYATNYPSSGGAMDETSSCASAQLFNFSKRSDGYWNIRLKNADGTYPTKSYVTNTSDNNFDKAVAAEPSYGWDITSGSGGSYIIRYRGNPGNWSGGSVGSGNWQTYYNIKAYQSGSVMSFKCYNEDQAGSTTYKAVYLGSCEERLYSSNPTITPHVYISGEIKVTSTAGQNVKASTVLTVSATNIATSSLTVTSNNAAFTVSPTSITVSGRAVPLTYITVTYNPTLTTDGIEEATITVSDGAPTPTTATTESGAVQGRHLPAQFVIAGRIGDIWYSLPADMETMGTYDPVQIEVDDINDPTSAVIASNTSAYSLAAVVSGNFATNGDKVRFRGIDNKALRATDANNSSGIRNWSFADASTSFYEWTLTTTDLETYGIQNDGHRTNSGNSSHVLAIYKSSGVYKWGLYAGGITELRLLPATFVEYIELPVVEWFPTKVMVDYRGSATTCKVSLNGSSDADKTFTGVDKNAGWVEIPIAELGTASNFCKQLRIKLQEGGVWKYAFLQTPVIVSRTDKSMTSDFTSSNPGYEACAYCDLVVRDGATFTADEAEARNAFFNVHVYPGAKINVPASKTFVTNSLTLRGGQDDIYNGSTYTTTRYLYPQILLNGKLKKTISAINYDYRIDLQQYYALSLPYGVLRSNIKHIDGSAATFRVRQYNGASRATGGTGWEANNGDLTANRGYTVAAQKQEINGNRRQTAILRFPMTEGILASNSTETGPKTIDVSAYAAAAPNDAGWNLVGNPYMSSFSNSANDGMGSAISFDSLVHVMDGDRWTGRWEYSGNLTTVRYVTIPNDNGTDYKQVRTTYLYDENKLLPFKNFFVQVAATGTLSFALTSRSLMPALVRKHAQAREYETELFLWDNESQDNAGLLIGDDYTDDYEIGSDLSKEFGTANSLKVYTLSGGQPLAFNSLNEQSAAGEIPVGYRAPKQGIYTFGLNLADEVTDFESIILTDHEEGISTDLIYDDYEFVTHAGQNDERFTLSVRIRDYDVQTDIDRTDHEGGLLDLHVSGANGQITLVGLPHGADVYVYDMTGKLAARNTANDTRLHIAVPHGIYNVRVVSNQGNATTKVVVD